MEELQEKNELQIWKESTAIEEIKKCFAPKLNEVEWQTFLALGKATGLNPFLREIWCIKYGEKDAAQIFISRDGYRKSAQLQADYDYHQVDAVYSNDNFGVKEGQVYHLYNVTNRGNLIGAYCVVKRRTSSMPQYVYIEAKEYLKHQSVWKEKPATMLKKVAEAQALRMAFQNVFAGTYSEFEEWKRDEIARNQHLRAVSEPKAVSLTDPIDVCAPVNKLSKEEVLELVANIDFAQDVNELLSLWGKEGKRVRLLPKSEQDSIINHFKLRKHHLTNAPKETQEPTNQ